MLRIRLTFTNSSTCFSRQESASLNLITTDAKLFAKMWILKQRPKLKRNQLKSLKNETALNNIAKNIMIKRRVVSKTSLKFVSKQTETLPAISPTVTKKSKIEEKHDLSKATIKTQMYIK